MKLKSLTLQNFRCFEHLEMDLHPQLTVLIAENGGGKTAVLDALFMLFFPFIIEITAEKKVSGKYTLIKESDIRFTFQKNNIQIIPHCVIIAVAILDQLKTAKTWFQSYSDISIQTDNIQDYAIFLLEILRDGKSVTLPLIRKFSTNRIWRNEISTSVAKETAFDAKDFSRLSGYSGCLSSEVNFSEFASWFGWVNRSYREEQMDAQEEGVPLSEDGKHFLTIIKVIQGAVDSITKETTGWHSLQYRSSQNKQLVMRHDENGFIPVEMLSDGIRNTIAMVADIAYRACKLNPHLGINAAKETDGVVLIDEVDMFLHPKWQQTILKSLTDAFPKIQFIVTTHSPQVLSTVRRENICVLPAGKMPEFSPLAHESGDALAKLCQALDEKGYQIGA